MYPSFSAIVALAATAAAKTVVITAGSGGFVFSPDSVTADVGDTLEFHFVGSIHTAVSGDFSSPCSGSSTGFDSGSISSADVFQVTVQNTDPIYFFCATPTHCQGGMVGVVNGPSTGNTLAAYKAAAAGTSSSSSAGKAQGGVVVAAGSSGSGSSSSSIVSSSTTSPPKTSSTLSGSASTSIPSVLSSNSSAATGSKSSGSGSPTASPSSTPSPTSSPTPASTGAGNSLVEMGEKITLWAAALGLGVFVVLMA